jgi:hypothetical protein
MADTRPEASTVPGSGVALTAASATPHASNTPNAVDAKSSMNLLTMPPLSRDRFVKGRSVASAMTVPPEGSAGLRSIASPYP